MNIQKSNNNPYKVDLINVNLTELHILENALYIQKQKGLISESGLEILQKLNEAIKYLNEKM